MATYRPLSSFMLPTADVHYDEKPNGAAWTSSIASSQQLHVVRRRFKKHSTIIQQPEPLVEHGECGSSGHTISQILRKLLDNHLPPPRLDMNVSTAAAREVLDDAENNEPPATMDPPQDPWQTTPTPGNNPSDATAIMPVGLLCAPSSKLTLCFKAPFTRSLYIATISLDAVANDAGLIDVLQQFHKNMRGWTRLFLRLQAMHYVKIELKDGDAAIVEIPALPPDDRRDYAFWPRPIQCLPPYPPHLLGEYLQKVPAEIDPSQTWIWRSFPKQVDSHNVLKPQPKTKDLSRSIELRSSENVAWGVHVEEKLDTLFALCLALFVCTIVVHEFVSTLKPNLADFATLLFAFILTFIIIYVCCIRLTSQRGAATIREVNWVIQSIDLAPLTSAFCLSSLTRGIRSAYFCWRTRIAIIIPWLQRSQFTECNPNRHPLNRTFAQGTGFSSRSQGQETGESSAPRNESESSSRSTYIAPERGSRGSGHSNHDGDENDDERGRDGPHSRPEFDEIDVEAAELYIHVILPDSLYDQKQVAVRVTQVQSDYELSMELNRTYRLNRGSWRSIFTVEALRPRKYELFNRNNVRVLFDAKDLASTMPDLHRPPPEYSFSFHPAIPIPDPPLLHEAQLTHLYHNPSSSTYCDEQGHIIFDHQCYDRSPKRKGILSYTPNSGFPTAYGFEFKESFDVKFVFTCELFIALLAFLLAGLYWGVSREDQKTSTAFNIAMFVFLFGQFLYGVILTLGERLEAWRYY